MTVRHWINNGSKERYYPVEKPIPVNWIVGRLGSTTQDKKAVSLNGDTLFVEPDEVESYLEKGYKLGIGKHNAPWKALDGKTLTCTYCGKTGRYQGMKVHHFENCKHKNFK